MTTPLRTGRRRKQRQRRLLWAVGFVMVLPLAFVSFEAWVTWLIYGVFLAIPVLAFGTALADTIYNFRGGYDRHTQNARDRFESAPPETDADIPAAAAVARPKKQRKRRKPKIRVTWFKNGWTGSAGRVNDDFYQGGM